MPVLDPQIGKPYRYGNDHIFVPAIRRNNSLTGTLFLSPEIYGHGDSIPRFHVSADFLAEYEIGNDDA